MGKRRESFEAVQQSVVRVKDAKGTTWGTGFFISREGCLLTCAHVVQNAGGWENVRILDQPVKCLYAGDPKRDDVCLLQVEDRQVTPIELGKDFDIGEEFLSFGFSNDDFYGAPIRGELTAFARCGKLGDQKLIRLETFSDAQRIEGGQSGAPVLVYKRGKYRAIGLIAASEDLQGGLAIPSFHISKRALQAVSLRKKRVSYLAATVVMAGISLTILGISYSALENSCSSELINKYRNLVNEAFSGERYESALNISEELISKCTNASEPYLYKGASLMYLNRYEDAIAAFKASLSKSPNFKATFNLGIAYGRVEQFENGINTLETLLQAPEITTSSSISRNDIFFHIGLFNQQIARSEFRKTSKLWNSTKILSHLEKAARLYNAVIRETGASCRVDNAGSCYSTQRSKSADNLTAVYSVLYSISKNKIYLDQASKSIEIAFEARSQDERIEDFKLYMTGEHNDVLAEIKLIRTSSQFSSVMQQVKVRYKM
jgi:tetratricopeptide (TPR) repeat protein